MDIGIRDQMGHLASRKPFQFNGLAPDHSSKSLSLLSGRGRITGDRMDCEPGTKTVTLLFHFSVIMKSGRFG